MERYTDLIYGIALSQTRNRDDADDVYQEVFLIYYRKQPIFREEEHRKAWLIRTAVNCSKKIILSTWRKKTAPLDGQKEEGVCFSSKVENEVFGALATLPEKYRIVLHLYYFEEMTADEISRMLKIKPGTVRMQLLRGRDMLRGQLKGGYFDE